MSIYYNTDIRYIKRELITENPIRVGDLVKVVDGHNYPQLETYNRYVCYKIMPMIDEDNIPCKLYYIVKNSFYTCIKCYGNGKDPILRTQWVLTDNFVGVGDRIVINDYNHVDKIIRIDNINFITEGGTVIKQRNAYKILFPIDKMFPLPLNINDNILFLIKYKKLFNYLKWLPFFALTLRLVLFRSNYEDFKKVLFDDDIMEIKKYHHICYGINFAGVVILFMYLFILL